MVFKPWLTHFFYYNSHQHTSTGLWQGIICRLYRRQADLQNTADLQVVGVQSQKLSSMGLPSTRTSYFHNTCNLKMSCQERISKLLSLQLPLCVSTYQYLYPYTCICAHTQTCTQNEEYRMRSTACALENVLQLLFAHNFTTVAAPGIARSNKLQSAEVKSRTVKAYVKLRMQTVVKSSLITFSLLYNGLQWKVILYHVISHRNMQNSLSFINVDQTGNRKRRDQVTE